MSARMRDIVNQLESGEPTNSVELRWFCSQAARAIETFNGVPSHRLFVTDLIHKRSLAESYLANRKD